MYFLYSLLFTLGIVVLLPRFLFDALRHGKYVAGLGERLGYLPPVNTKGRAIIWLHCVSVGETQAARPVAQALLEQFPDHALVVSTITLTGQRVAREVFREEAAAVFYFPFDWAWTVRRALRKVNPRVVVVMETELWPRFLRECRKRGVRVALINGRLSEKSFRRYKLIRRFIKRVLGCLDLALMQSESDAARIRALGLDARRVEVSGNVKFDLSTTTDEHALTESLRRRFAFEPPTVLIVAASTHEPEERIIIEAFKQLRATPFGGRARLLIAPRHPERFDDAQAILQSSGLSWACRSRAPEEADKTCGCVLLDSIGELRAVYPLATIVFVGGSIAPRGGHNVLEPAAARACIITGAHTNNFTAITDAFLERAALVQLPPLSEGEAPDALARAFTELLSDDARRREMTESALGVIEKNRGATARTVERIAKLLSDSTFGSSRGKTEITARAHTGKGKTEGERLSDESVITQLK